ncbi:MAG: GNAT family N-acetyltransferase, partial [Polyangiaceae bacterium]
LYTVAVHPERQRRGIGAALVKHLEGELARRGCSKVNLQVIASNAAVVEFTGGWGLPWRNGSAWGRC